MSPCHVLAFQQEQDDDERIDPETNLKNIRQQLLKEVNTERALHGLRPVELDDFASKVADQHALEQAKDKFTSHWGRDGRKPYMRYSLAGGTDAVAENICGFSGVLVGVDMPELGELLIDMHKSLYEEKPPHDGHRRTILTPQHTHVGFGITTLNGELRLVEEFISRYVQVSPLPGKAKRNDVLTLSGKVLKPTYKIHSIDIFYEPLPTTPEMSWLRASGSYSLPETRTMVVPKPPEGGFYSGGLTGELEMKQDGTFRAPIKLYKKEPGIYTIVVWVQTRSDEPPFPATNVCVQSD